MADATTNHRADLYASGAVIYEMLAGAPPYSGNAQAVVAAHLTAPVPRIEDRRNDVPPAVASLITRLMAKNPAERPQSAQEVAVAFEQLTSDGTSASMAAGAAAPATTSTAVAGGRASTLPRPRRAVLFAVATAAVVAAGAFWWRSSASAAPMIAGADVIAVMPLVGMGDTATGRLGRDLVVTLSANLDGVGTLRAVDAMSVLQRAQQLEQPVPLDEARALGADLGARSVLHGSLVREGPMVRAEAGLYPVAGGDALARLSVLGSPDSLRALTDALSAALLREVWRRGTPPSPLLSDVTTANGEALRAFLEGERAFTLGDKQAALDGYQRAVQADSLFAQAWLRIDYQISLAVLPADPRVRERLAALRHRLPDRDRELLELRWTTGIPLRQRVDSGRVLAAKYPDYHTAQYQVGDNIIHTGAIVGIPIRDALPFLERLEALAPTHADNALHRLMVNQSLGDTAQIVRAAKDLEARSGADFNGWGAGVLRSIDADVTGRRIPPDSIVADLRLLVGMIRSNPQFGWWPAGLWHPSQRATDSEEWLAVARRSGLMAGEPGQLLLSEAALDVARGNVARGVERLSELESPGMQAPSDVRGVAARVAAQSAWLGTMDVQAASAVVTRARSRLGDLTGLDAIELDWSDAVVAIAAEDSVRLARALARITDTTAFRNTLTRGLRGLWRERQTGNADSLMAAEDEAMARSLTFAPALPLTRAAVGRSLVKSGNPQRAEHYLMWTDAMSTTRRTVSVLNTASTLNHYERGLASEAAGDRAGAMLYLTRFVGMMDQPPPSLRGQVDDAKARLARLRAAKQ